MRPGAMVVFLKALVLLVGTSLASGQLDCKVYTQFGGPVPDAKVLSTTTVKDAFPVGTINVKGIQLQHGRVAALKVSLLHSTSGQVTTSVTLKDVRSGGNAPGLSGTSFSDSASAKFPTDAAAAPFTGVFKPEEALSAIGSVSSEGEWTLRVVDLAQETNGHKISVEKWSLELCPGGEVVTKADSPAAPVNATPTAEVPVEPKVNSMSGPSHGSFRSAAKSQAQGLVDKLTPKKDDKAPDSALDLGSTLYRIGADNVQDRVDAVKDTTGSAGKLVHGLLSDLIRNAVDLAGKQKNLVKEGISDAISTHTKAVTGAAKLTQDKLIRGAELLQGNVKDAQQAGESVVGFWRNSAAGHQETLGKHMNNLLQLLGGLSQKGVDMGSDISAVGSNIAKAMQEQLTAKKDVLNTATGLLRSQSDSVLRAKIDGANTLLDHVINFLKTTQGMTGPVLDKALEGKKSGLSLLRSSLIGVKDNMKKVPTVSDVVGRVAGNTKSALDNTRVAKVLQNRHAGVDAALKKLMDNAGVFGSLMDKLGL